MERRGCHFSHGQNPVRSSSFRGLSLFRNHTETLAMQARLDALGKTKVWKRGVGGGGFWSRVHSHSFFTRVPHHELLSSLFWISVSYPVLHSCLNFGESHFAGVVKPRIPFKFPKSRTIQILHPRTTLPDPAKRFLPQRIFTTWYGLTLCVFKSFAFEQTSYVIM